ncbi:MAG: hypothetical protein EON95_10645 [Caulobacteraceae bacterium]|nr:MAG: hypothetical protein EON95_10645 [Caulobacteraceae bacterium]
MTLVLAAPAIAAQPEAAPSDQRCLNLALNYGYATVRIAKASGLVFYYLGRLEGADPARDWISEAYAFLASPAAMGDLFNAEWKADFKVCTARMAASAGRLNDAELKLNPPPAPPEDQSKAPPFP